MKGSRGSKRNSIVTKHNARCMNETGYAFNMNKKEKAKERAPVTGIIVIRKVCSQV